MSSADTEVMPGDSAAEGEYYTKAILNILEDIDSDRNRLAATQSAILNILDDFDAERRKVEEANADLEVANEAMRGFVAVAAHDLRSPLASIVGFSALLNAVSYTHLRAHET